MVGCCQDLQAYGFWDEAEIVVPDQSPPAAVNDDNSIWTHNKIQLQTFATMPRWDPFQAAHRPLPCQPPDALL